MGQGATPIPSQPDSITPGWLTSAFRESGTLKSASVQSIQVDPVMAGSGFVGQAARLHIKYDREEPGAPAIAFLKLSSADPDVREKMRTVGLYKSEAGFYKDFAAAEKLPIRVPRPYVSQYDETTAASILLIEDLSQARFGNNVAGCSPEEARTAVRNMALLHAHFWESPRLEDCRWLRSISGGCRSEIVLYRETLPRFKDRWAEILTPGLAQTASRFADVQQEYYGHCSVGPQTLVHGDFRADNFAFTQPSENDGFILFDWQCSHRGRGARDMAYFMANSMMTALRRKMEKELLQLYFDTLAAHGVKAYSSKDFLRDFRCGLGRALTVLVVAGAVLDFSSERGAQLAREICARVGSALEDYQFGEFLDEIIPAGVRSAKKVSIEKHESYSGGYAPSLLQGLLRREAAREAAFFIPQLEPHMNVLDCGCGPGGITLGLAALVPQGQAVGVDIQAEQLELGRQRARERGLDNVQFKQASAYELPFEDNSFDAVLAHAILYHLGEPKKALEEIFRVLKPGGVLGIRDADVDGDVYHPQNPLLEQFWKLSEKVMSHNGGDLRFGRRHRQILREAGFVEIVGTSSCDSYGTPESTLSFSKYFGEAYLNQHRELILKQGWATAADLEAMRDALLSWGNSQDAFYSRCRCEALGRKPTN